MGGNNLDPDHRISQTEEAEGEADVREEGKTPRSQSN